MNRVYVTRAFLPSLEEYTEEIRELFVSHNITNMGEKHALLTDQLKRYLDVDGLMLLANGHMALELSIQAMGLAGEIITTPFTFASTTHAIVRSGLKPVFCDIRENDYTIDTDQIESLITDKTSGILPVHVYGNVCAVDEIDRIAKKYHLKVLYDAAHAFGVRYKGRGIGRFGDLSAFSFHATKVYNTIEGGAVAFRDRDIGLKLYQLSNFGIMDEETVSSVGMNAKMNEFQAAMGICNLRHIDAAIAARGEIWETYKAELAGVPGIITSDIPDDITYNYAYFPVRIVKETYGESRKEIIERLRSNGFFPRKYFYPLTSSFSCYRDLFDPGSTPVARRVSEEIMTLPLYPELQLDQVKRICQLILNGRDRKWAGLKASESHYAHSGR